ncbi:Phosphatidylinositol synthase (PIS) [Plasmopara halstedii]|uniref:CDP-diacylglycerol--inositol 3-phosphatidyltransferase n=1 Tax=Plasmopara halstedii TaxID=4781 RepID=A0A0N7L8K7_PLAHL|nr:Phosphatidylinositol synthase (PIS) [Plasmopara halstedii]CEG50147.1 Phosphatidylinositol synthase (PIS) [Plasmopara halstedii]|eukprot:XP_024586516.1 Phosphatidylinositol synthase (PIS) [Plasmopara halstedii]
MTERTVMGVFFYVPNLIGYMRVLLTLYSLAVAFTNYKVSVLCYALSFTCDYFDGFFARLCNQSSTYGAVLDMVTDRCSTAGLLLVLSHLYPQYWIIFLYLLILDFSSHWYHMYSSRGHHKVVSAERNFVLRFYYGFYPFFGFCCVGAELFYILLYVLHFNPTVLIPIVNVPVMKLCFYVCLPACICKNIVNLAQLCSAASSIATDDVKLANKTK